MTVKENKRNLKYLQSFVKKMKEQLSVVERKGIELRKAERVERDVIAGAPFLASVLNTTLESLSNWVGLFVDEGLDELDSSSPPFERVEMIRTIFDYLKAQSKSINMSNCEDELIDELRDTENLIIVLKAKIKEG